MSWSDHQLLIFDGESTVPFGGAFGGRTPGRVSALQALDDGGVAVAIDGRGLFILSESGDHRLALTTDEYHRVHDLAAREHGVLWIATERAVQKLLYSSPVTIVDQRLGVTVNWPRVLQWQGKTLISSSGRLYEGIPSEDGLSHRFRHIEDLPAGGAWGAEVAGSDLLVGSGQGLFVRGAAAFEHVVPDIAIDRLAAVSPAFVYAIGAGSITAMRRVDGRWVESAERIAGVGFPFVVHVIGESAWIELGANRTARISFEDGILSARVFDNFPWSEPKWINIGSVGDIVVMSGGQEGIVFFDERTGDFCEAPELRHVIDSVSFPIARIKEDQHGLLWLTHDMGVVIGHPDASTPVGYRFHRPFERFVTLFQPNVQFSGLDDVWMITEKSLCRVSRPSLEIVHPPLQPFLVSISDAQAGVELHSVTRSSAAIETFPYAQNSLSFRYFSGGYATNRRPLYEFRMSGGTSEWTTLSTDSVVTLRDLKEGAYKLSARLLDNPAFEAEPVVVSFAIAPPWHRTAAAYAGYVVALVAGGCGTFFWAVRRTRRRNAYLENLARERSQELRLTMDRLNEETRNTATLAERNRLAGEIHDSLQQGLNGLMLQLDATLKLANLEPEVRSRLQVARNMVSFTRQEVQQAVWDLESPLLEGVDLTGALKKMAGLISSGRPQVEIKTTGRVAEMSSTTTHQLLRIAQEAITNAVRHGNAKKIFVHLDYSSTAVSLEIFDDGCGFVPQEIFTSGLGHFGLRGLRGRASRINGDLRIISAPNRGTTLRILVPLAADATPNPAANPNVNVNDNTYACV